MHKTLLHSILVAKKALKTMLGHVRIKFGNPWSTKTKKNIGVHLYKFSIGKKST